MVKLAKSLAAEAEQQSSSSPKVSSPRRCSSGDVPQQPAEAGGADREVDSLSKVCEAYGTGEDQVLRLSNLGGGPLFAFRFGCLVCWDFTTPQVEAAKAQLREFMKRPLVADDIEEDQVGFVFDQRPALREDEEEEDASMEPRDRVGRGHDEGSTSQAIKHDQIVLATNEDREKLAHSYALAQSVRLGAFETNVERSIAEAQSIPETMATEGEVRLDAKELSKQMGRLLMLRCDVNLHTDILDTPEIFWDEERFEPQYDACRSFLDIDKRVEILNQRLGVLKDLYDLLQNGVNVKNSDFLEWIIIILILFEVVLEFLELVYDAWQVRLR